MVRAGARAGSATVTTHCVPSGDGVHPRVGFVVGKTLGNAVERNRVRRRLRAIITAELDSLTGVDVVVRAHPKAREASFDDLQSDVVGTLSRSRVKAGA